MTSAIILLLDVISSLFTSGEQVSQIATMKMQVILLLWWKFKRKKRNLKKNELNRSCDRISVLPPISFLHMMQKSTIKLHWYLSHCKVQQNKKKYINPTWIGKIRTLKINLSFLTICSICNKQHHSKVNRQ